MDFDGKRRGAPTRRGCTSRTSVDGNDAPVVTVSGPQTIVATRQLGSPTFAAAVHSLQATTASHFLTVPLIRPRCMMHCPAESTLTSSTSPYRVLSDRLTDEYPVHRVSAYNLSPHNVQQQQQQQQQQQRGYAQKRRRSTYLTDSPPWDFISSTVTRSTALNEFPTSLLGSSSTLSPSFLRRHPPHHHHSFPPLSFLYRTGATSGVASSVLLPPWSGDLSPARSALGQVAGCLGAVPPPPYPCLVQRGDTHLSPQAVDVCHEPKTEQRHQQHPQRRLSVSGTDKLSSLTVVTHQCTPSDALTYSSGGNAADASRHQLTEGTWSLYYYTNWPPVIWRGI